MFLMILSSLSLLHAGYSAWEFKDGLGYAGDLSPDIIIEALLSLLMFMVSVVHSTTLENIDSHE